jgi:outer membrane protein TolC/ABC-type uncharacterized transport system substrate-binding protein
MKTNRLTIWQWWLLFTIVGLLIPIQVLEAKTRLNIALVADGGGIKTGNTYFDIAKNEISSLLQNDFDVHFSDDYFAQWDLISAQHTLKKALNDKQVDIVVTTGFLTSQATLELKNFNKPVFATIIADSRLQGFPRQHDKSGVANFVYLDRHLNLQEDLELFHQLVGFKKLAILVDDEVLKFDNWHRAMNEIAQSLKFEFHFIPVKQGVKQILASLDNSDAVFVGLSQHLNPESLDELAIGIKNKQLPSFSMYGEQSLEKGFLVSFSTENSVQQIARRIATYTAEIAKGTPANELNVDLHLKKNLYINESLANTLGVSLDWVLLNKARLLNPVQAKNAKHISLKETMDQAAQANLEAVKQNSVVAAGKENINIADSYWFPQLNGGIRAGFNDGDRAAASFGTQPEYHAEALVQLRQLIYDENLWANRSIQRYLQEVRLSEQQTVLLDVRLKAAFAYLSVLRLEVLATIQQSNLDLTLANLKNAETRVSAGTADKSEIYRWQSAEARNRQDLLTAEAQVKVARTALNQVLNLPLDTELTLDNAQDADTLLIFNQELIKRYLNTPKEVGRFQSFMVKIGLDHAPEVAALSESIEAQDRQLTAKKRVMFIPSIEVNANVVQTVDRAGAGLSRPAGFNVDRTDATVAVQLSLPLLTGGKQLAEVDQESYQLQRLKTELSLIDQLVEQRIRNAIDTLQASYPGVFLAENSAVAAESNLKIIEQAYRNGMISIITLLDAQQALLTSEQASANANYKFLMDLIELQRSLGDFDAFYSKGFQANLIRDLDTYLAGH